MEYDTVARGAHRIFSKGVIGGGRGQWLGGTMASAEHEPITAVSGQSPWSGSPEAEIILVIGCLNGAGKFSPFPKMHLYFYSRCNGNDMGKIYVEIQGG